MLTRRGFARLGALAGSALLSSRGFAAADVIANTSSGKVRGVTEDGVNVFKGIPYGASTGGVNRWLPPQDPQPWSGVRDATVYGPAAEQIPSERVPLRSEDCLVLNVWSRGLNDGAKRPVMVWLHGGGFSSLSGSSPMYDGVNLCQRGDVVVVTLNHRLNVFGFLHLGDLAGPEYATSGNVGMLDLVHALKWVRDNIGEFGGDPDSVTIFGESGGGRKVSTLLAMPDAQGLFHRAIIQSGPGIHLQPRDKSHEMAVALFQRLELDANELHKLKALPAEQILAAYGLVVNDLEPDRRAKGHFEQRGFVPAGNASPLMIGCNRLATARSTSVQIKPKATGSISASIGVPVTEKPVSSILDAFMHNGSPWEKSPR